MLPGKSRGLATTVLSTKNVLERMMERKNDALLAFYSSVWNGIVTDSSLMCLPMDDHLVHRGHGVFDTALLRNGKVYQLEQHLDRFERSARKCQLWKPNKFLNKENLKHIILDSIRAGRQKDQLIRYFLGAGPGGFDISVNECKDVSFYVMCLKYKEPNPLLYKEGVKVITSSIPLRPKSVTEVKSTNYLLNALTVIEAEKEGAYRGVWVDKNGYVAETAVNCIGFVKKDELIVPTFENSLAGITIQRMMELMKAHTGMQVVQRDIHISEAKQADEAFLCGGNTSGLSIVQWDDDLIGSGKAGPVAQKVRQLFDEDKRHGHGDQNQLITIDELM